jgi:hypothetical protein
MWGSTGPTRGPPSPGTASGPRETACPHALPAATPTPSRWYAGTPFPWHGRRYVVREVLDHWLQTGAWWQAGALTRLTSGESSGPEGVGPPSSGLEDEREFWRVDAAPGPSGTPVVVDLCHVLASGRWALTAVLD